jgi:hypothetical protein
MAAFSGRPKSAVERCRNKFTKSAPSGERKSGQLVFTKLASLEPIEEL